MENKHQWKKTWHFSHWPTAWTAKYGQHLIVFLFHGWPLWVGGHSFKDHNARRAPAVNRLKLPGRRVEKKERTGLTTTKLIKFCFIISSWFSPVKQHTLFLVFFVLLKKRMSPVSASHGHHQWSSGWLPMTPRSDLEVEGFSWNNYQTMSYLHIF